VRSLLTVHDMLAMVLFRWGNAGQREKWLPKLARGEVIGAFGVSEPNVGSDPKSVETTAVKTPGGSFILDGKKKWITSARSPMSSWCWRSVRASRPPFW
jgi:alkylation response protein AidB-like acyl-CoA dehydrogenase